MNFDENTIFFSRWIQQLVNEELLSQKLKMKTKLTLLALEILKNRSAKQLKWYKILKNFQMMN